MTSGYNSPKFLMTLKITKIKQLKLKLEIVKEKKTRLK